MFRFWSDVSHLIIPLSQKEVLQQLAREQFCWYEDFMRKQLLGEQQLEWTDLVVEDDERVEIDNELLLSNDENENEGMVCLFVFCLFVLHTSYFCPRALHTWTTMRMLPRMMYCPYQTKMTNEWCVCTFRFFFLIIIVVSTEHRDYG